MSAKHRSVVVVGLVVLFIFWSGRQCVLAQAGNDVPPVPTEELPAGSEVLTSGPVHEAFAKPVTIQHEAGIEAPTPPPANIAEAPPIEKPVGASIVWVPGYWAWDAERNDYIWVSGCWRSAPPNMRWIPGYWRELGGRYEWVSGFWTRRTEEERQQIEYLPAPPAPVEIEPLGRPLAPDQFWVPGCWYWSQSRWILRHGYWHAPYAGWVWVPSRHAWTPRGYVFCAGYWDHDLDNRGVLFTPVYFPQGVRGRIDFAFVPSVCIDLGLFRLNLFTYPRYHHYYFGDFYDDAYVRLGIHPWFDCQKNHSWYDPIFVYDRWHLTRTEPHWLENQRHQYTVLRSNRSLRPARTYTEFQTRMARLPESERRAPHLVAPLKAYAVNESTPTKFERINTAERQQIVTKTAEARSFREQRARWEAPAARPAATEHQPVETKPVRAAVPSAAERSTARSKGVAQPVEAERARKPVPSAAERSTARPKATAKPAVVPPHEVRATQSERVQIPSSPIVDRPAATRYIPKEPPTQPTQERSLATQGPDQKRKGTDRDQQKNPR